MIQIDVEFMDDGTAKVTLPEGKKVKGDPAKIAALTLQIAKALGPILERHAAHTHITLDDGSEKVIYHEQAGQGHTH